MPPVNLTAQASQAAAQGQQQLANDNSQAASSKAQYGTYQNAADSANNQVNDYSKYMAGEGSGGNQYNVGLGSQLGQLGYDPAQMTAARNNLNRSTGALSAYSDFANTGAAKFGLNAGGFAAANSGALSGINNNIAAQQGVVNGLGDLFKTAQTGANQFAGQQVQGEQNTLGGFQNAYKNAADQRDQAASMMNFYTDQAQKQGGTNATVAQGYAQAQQAYAAATQALAQASQFSSQAALNNQQFTNVGEDRASLAAKSAASADQASANLYNQQNNIKYNGQIDNQGNKIYTGQF